MKQYISVAIFFILSLLILSCGGSGSSPNPDPSNQPSPGNPDPTLETLLPNKLLGFVSDNNGELIPYASLGGAVTGNSGITNGKATASTTGWYEVKADGYTTGYTRVSGEVNGISIINTRLTPIDRVIYHPVGGDISEVIIGPIDTPYLTASFPADLFLEDAIIEITQLDSSMQDTTYAKMDTADTLFINLPFDITARSASSGEILQPQPGQAASISLLDNGALGDPPRLFWFDPEKGKWQEHQTACSRIDAENINCQLEHFSQHGGGGTAPPPPSGGGDDYSQASDNTDAAARDAAEDMAERDRNGEEISICDFFTPAVIAGFMAEVDAAIAEAKAKPSEAAKAKLLRTAGRLQLLGGFTGNYEPPCDVFPPEWAHSPDPYADLMDEADTVTQKLADEVLKNPDCPDIDRIEKVLAEAHLLGVTEVIPPLESEYRELLDRCNLWEGRIEYSILLPKSVEPAPNGVTLWESGPKVWTEYHDIQISLHASGLTERDRFATFDGTDKVQTDFAEVSYKFDIKDTGCNFPVYHTSKYKGDANPGSMEVIINGRFNPQIGFEPDSMTQASTVDLVTDRFETGFTYEGKDLECVKKPDTEWTAPNPYRGQVREHYEFNQNGGQGQPFASMNGKKFDSLWDILNKGPNSSSTPTKEGEYPRDFYRGSAVLDEAAIPLGMPDMRVIMRWNLVHTDYTKGR